MPITVLFSCFCLLGLLLLIPAVPVSVALLLSKKKRAALAVLCVPASMIVLSILLSLLVFVALWLYSHSLSSHPDRLFKMTFGFAPPPETYVLEAYHDLGQDYAITVMKFRTTQDVVDRIVSNKFSRSDRETCVGYYDGGFSDLPERVRSWFPPPQEPSMQWYIAKGFDGSYGSDKAILCHDEETQIVYFHWVGVD